MKLKTDSNIAKSFNAVIAGLLIGLGVIINTQTKPPILGALLFSFGLLTIIHLKLPLYTGKIGYLKDKLVLILVFNLIGIGITVAAYYVANPQFHELISAAASIKLRKRMLKCYSEEYSAGCLFILQLNAKCHISHLWQ